MIKFINKFAVVFLATALFCGCAEDDNTESGERAPAGTDTYGSITDANGTPLEGVVVTDGYTCVATNAEGMYSFIRNADAYYVYYTLPATSQVKFSRLTGLPEFYARLDSKKMRYDFSLTSLPAAETRFNLFCIGDPQVDNISHVMRFNTETVPDLNAYAKKETAPNYAICLGDLVNNKWALIPNMVYAMQQPKTGMPVFQTIGNHDHDFNQKTELQAQRNYESYCGPVNYSFDRGEVHIVSMDNVIHACGASDNYVGGFLDWQYKWLEQDLSFVSKDKMVILCVHVPFRTGSSNDVGKDKYYNEVLSLLAQYESATIMSAHTHSNVNYIHTVNGKEIYEHVTGTSCGAWWKSTVCTEGTPNGYAVYRIDGTSVKDWIYKPVNYDDSFQIRMYRGTDKFKGGSSTYTFAKTGAGQIIANIWNADPSWTVSVYENGTKSGEMEPYTDKDAWTVAYHMGTLGNTSTSYSKQADHMYYYTLQNAAASVKVVATDRFGRTYSQTEFTNPNSNPGSY